MKSAAIMLEIAEYPEYLAISMMRKFFKPNCLDVRMMRFLSCMERTILYGTTR